MESGATLNLALHRRLHFWSVGAFLFYFYYACLPCYRSFLLSRSLLLQRVRFYICKWVASSGFITNSVFISELYKPDVEYALATSALRGILCPFWASGLVIDFGRPFIFPILVPFMMRDGTRLPLLYRLVFYLFNLFVIWA